MKTTPPVVLLLLGFCVGTGFGWFLGLGRDGPVPVAVELPIPSTPQAQSVDETPVMPTATAVPVPHVASGDWRAAAHEIRQYSGDSNQFDEVLASKEAAFPGNPTAAIALLFAAAEWADRVGDPSAKLRKETIVAEFDQYWLLGLPWRLEALQHKAALYKMNGRPDMEEYCVQLSKHAFDDTFTYYCARREVQEERTQLERSYSAALKLLGRSGHKLDVLWNRDFTYDTLATRVHKDKGRLFLSEMLRSPPEDSAFNWLAEYPSLSVEERVKIGEARVVLIRLLDQEAERTAEDQQRRDDEKFGRHRIKPKIKKSEDFIFTDEDLKKLQEYDPVKANKEYRDLTADPPLPKPGEKAPPKPPEEKLIPYLKDPTNKDPKANGLGLSIETLTDVTRAELGPLPFPLPVRLSGLEGARNPPLPPPGMMSDRAKTQLTYKPRRALMSYLKKQAGRDIPDNYGKVDVPLMIYDSQREYQSHKDNKAECYFLIGRNLEHAQRLLLEDPIQIRRSGIGLAEVSAQFVWQDLKDKPLAAAITDLYVMPYLHLGDKRRENHLSKHHLLGSATATYTYCEFPDKLLLAAEEACRESSDQNGQDARRFCIAKALVQLKKVDEAIKTLEQVTDPSLVNGAKGYIATIKKEHGLP